MRGFGGCSRFAGEESKQAGVERSRVSYKLRKVIFINSMETKFFLKIIFLCIQFSPETVLKSLFGGNYRSFSVGGKRFRDLLSMGFPWRRLHHSLALDSSK